MPPEDVAGAVARIVGTVRNSYYGRIDPVHNLREGEEP
jgi:hypothetical protein